MITKLISFTVALFEISLHDNFESDWAPVLRNVVVYSYCWPAITHQANVHVCEENGTGRWGQRRKPLRLLNVDRKKIKNQDKMLA
jgi:hypothetical protein